MKAIYGSKKKYHYLYKTTNLVNNNSQYGTMWITNEIESKKIKKEDKERR